MQDSSDSPSRVLVYAESALADHLAAVLRKHGCEVQVALDADHALRLVARETFGMAIVTSKASTRDTPDHDGLELLRAIRRCDPLAQVLLLIDQSADLSVCCHAASLGAAGFIDLAAKSFEQQVLERIKHAKERLRLVVRENEEFRSRSIFEQTGIAGQSRAMADLLLDARRAARISDASILILGESGTGKQLLAEAIHRMDAKRCDNPFFSVNCSAITGTLAESALFGHKRGSFTGATEDRAGYFRSANGGTVLLDEVSGLDAALQPKLLRVLQEGKVMPVGSDKELQVDLRVIAASNQDLVRMVVEGRFREDLYQRLNVITLCVPPLRQRLEDVPLLFQHFLRKYAHYCHEPIRSVDPRVYEVVADTLGPGNVRELENMVRRILAFKEVGGHIGLNDLPDSLVKSRATTCEHDLAVAADAVIQAFCGLIRRGSVSLTQMVDECERALLRTAIEFHNSSQADLAAKLGMTRRTFYNKVKKHRLPRSTTRSDDS